MLSTLITFGLISVACVQENDAQTISDSLTVVKRFYPQYSQFPEGLTVGEEGIYVGMAALSQILRIDGKNSFLYAELPPLPKGKGFITGLIFDRQGNLYAGLASYVPEVQTGVYRIPPGGGEAVLFATHPDMAFPNDLAFDAAGNLLVSDSGAGAIFKIAPDGDVQRWSAAPLLAGDRHFCESAELEFELGANGLAIDESGTVFVANTDRASLIQIPTNEDGTAGTASVFVGPDCNNLEGADGLVIDQDGNFLVAANRINKLVRVKRDRSITVIESGGLLDFPASLAFSGDHSSLYITNLALISSQNPSLLRLKLQ